MKSKANETLSKQAHLREQWSGELLARFENYLASADPALKEHLKPLHEWFLCPVVIWPCNLQEVLESELPRLERGKPIHPALLLFLKMLPAIPTHPTQSMAAIHEHQVQTGEYEHLSNVSAVKHQEKENSLLENAQYLADWHEIETKFRIEKFADHKGVIRRTLVQERNFRTEIFMTAWKNADDRFQMIFDTFCAKWNLYGVQNSRPLLQKLSVNLTPFGTMIFIPSYWSLDAKRDINWNAVGKLHNARVPMRQGPALAASAKQREKDAKKLQQLESEAKRKGIRGMRQHNFICEGLGWDTRTDPKRIAMLKKVI